MTIAPFLPRLMHGKMTFDYRGDARPGLDATTTLEAIQLGRRTATTRYLSQGHLPYWREGRVGDLILFTGKDGDQALVTITQPIERLPITQDAASWSQLEGWSETYFMQKVRPRLGEAWQMRYELTDLTALTDLSTWPPLLLDYTNWRNEHGMRYVQPRALVYGATEYHPRAQFMLEATDLEKQAERSFALSGIYKWNRR